MQASARSCSAASLMFCTAQGVAVVNSALRGRLRRRERIRARFTATMFSYVKLASVKCRPGCQDPPMAMPSVRMAISCSLVMRHGTSATISTTVLLSGLISSTLSGILTNR